MSAAPFAPPLSDATRVEIERLRLEFEGLRVAVEGRVQAQENMVRAMLFESGAHAGETLEGRIQLATDEAIAHAEQGLSRQEAAIRALGRRFAEFSRQERAPESPEPEAAEARAYLVGVGVRDESDCLRIDIRDEDDAAFVADLAHLPIPLRGASKLVVSQIVQFVDAGALAATLLPHWRSRLAPGGELVVLTWDGPAWAADLAKVDGDFEKLKARLGADGSSRPLRHLLDAEGWARVLGEAGFACEEPTRRAPYALRLVARSTPP